MFTISLLYFHISYFEGAAYCLLETHVMPTFVKVSLSSEHLQEDIQVSIQCQERFMTHIDRCEIFIATFIATFIAPFDGNRLKPNRDQGLSPFTTPIDFSALL